MNESNMAMKEFIRLEIKFDKETGKEKGSWKGGTMGTSIDISVGESPLDAFTRYGTAVESTRNYKNTNRGFTDIKVVL